MKHSQITIFTLLLLFAAVSVFLNIFGILEIDSTTFFGYGLIFYGVASVYTSFGEKNKVLIFIGSAAFLTGIVISLPSHFDFIHPLNVFIPSSILIAGISLLIVFLDDTSNKTILLAASLLLIAGIIFILAVRNVQPAVFGESILKIIEVYWPVLLVISGITIILKR